MQRSDDFPLYPANAKPQAYSSLSLSTIGTTVIIKCGSVQRQGCLPSEATSEDSQLWITASSIAAMNIIDLGFIVRTAFNLIPLCTGRTVMRIPMTSRRCGIFDSTNTVPQSWNKRNYDSWETYACPHKSVLWSLTFSSLTASAFLRL
jgi:hypothetical protein